MLAASFAAAVCNLTGATLAQRPAGTTALVQANRLMREGQALYELGTEASFKASVRSFERAEELYARIGNSRLQAASLQKLGEVSNQLGENQRAIDVLNKALAIRKRLNIRYSIARTLSTLGLIYFELGNRERALDLCTRALQLWRDMRSRGDQASTLNVIGLIYTSLSENEKALQTFGESLRLRRLARDRTGEAITLRNIGSVYSNLRDKKNALLYFNQALELFRAIPNKTGEGATLSHIGKLHSDFAETQDAIFFLNSALPILREAGDVEREALTLSRLQDAWSAANEPAVAILFGKESVNKYQELRSNIRGLERGIRQNYLESVAATYRKLASLLVVQGQIMAAEQVLGMLKEEEYFSFVRRDSSLGSGLNARMSFTPEEGNARGAYDKFAPDITAAAGEFGMLDKKRASLPLGQSLNAADQRRYDELRAKYESAINEFTRFIESLKVKFGERDARVAAVESDTLGLLKRLNEPTTAILSTIVTEDRLIIIVTTSDVQTAHTVEVKAEEINRLVGDLRAALKDPRTDPRPAGKKLYDKLFPPDLKRDLDNIKADMIVWSLDGLLRYVPMAALWDGNKYLAERYMNSILTLASRDKLAHGDALVNGWLAFGVGVSKKYETFSDLPAVPIELCSIVNDPKKREFCKSAGVAEAGVIDGLMLPDDEFTLKEFQDNLGKTAVVHIRRILH